MKFETTDGPAKKIWAGVKKNAITFGEPVEEDTDEIYNKVWKAKPLPNGAVVSFHFNSIKGKNKAGKKRNPRYILALTHNNKTEKFSGGYARKVFDRLVKGAPGKRSNKLTEDTSTFCEDALSDI